MLLEPRIVRINEYKEDTNQGIWKHSTYIESFPSEIPQEGPKFYVTDLLKEKPSVAPSNVSKSLSIICKEKGRRWVVDLRNDGCYFTVGWVDPVDQRPPGYFWFQRGKRNSIQIGFESFFGMVHFGKDVNLNQMVKGRSHSFETKADTFEQDDVWTHFYDRGFEATVLFGNTEETEEWRLVNFLGTSLIRMSKKYLIANDPYPEENLEDLWRCVRLDRQFNKRVKKLIRFFSTLLLNFKWSEMYSCCDKVRKLAEAHSK